jgi:hypothetical protein
MKLQIVTEVSSRSKSIRELQELQKGEKNYILEIGMPNI